MRASKSICEMQTLLVPFAHLERKGADSVPDTTVPSRSPGKYSTTEQYTEESASSSTRSLLSARVPELRVPAGAAGVGVRNRASRTKVSFQ